jgi:Predicted NAD/FAD-binding protein
MSKRTDPEPGKKVAIVGSGCAGLAALWALSRSPHDVYLYEADSRLGGHSNTVEFVKGKYKVMVDTGFIVLNSATYRKFIVYCPTEIPKLPRLTEAANFIDFLKLMKVELEPTDMTFSVSRDQGWFEWSGSSVDALFCQRSNLMSPKMWRMIFDIIRFNYFALDVLRRDSPTDETIGEYLEREGYSSAFRDDYLIPMTAAIWSTSPDKCLLDFPAVTLIRFMYIEPYTYHETRY